MVPRISPGTINVSLGAMVTGASYGLKTSGSELPGMATTAERTDMGTGFMILFSILAAGSAGLMLFADGFLSAFGFGAAVVFGLLLVVAVHLYE